MDIDNLTLFLLSSLACLLVYYRFFSRPEPLVHPLLLGKQSEVSSVRREGESGVYRSWATGQGTPVSHTSIRGDAGGSVGSQGVVDCRAGKFALSVGLADVQLTVRPANALKTVHDIVQTPRPGSDGSSRSILGTEVSFPQRLILWTSR